MTLTPEEMTEEERVTANRYIDVDRRGNKTMTRHRMGFQGTLRFKNWSDRRLVVTASTGTPFKVAGCSEAVASFPVEAGLEMFVRIHPGYLDEEFSYSAQIDGTEAEDPIVIIDRR
jgi:hypothetical protein